MRPMFVKHGDGGYMAKPTLGKLPPKYKFILNPYEDTRVSRCPICSKLNHMRKFALLIHIDGWGLLVLGKTCRYCSLCELIVAHKDELEDELVTIFERHAPHVIGNPYLVTGTVDKKEWKLGMGTEGRTIQEMLERTADFNKVLSLKMEGGWRPMKEPKRSK
jgi:hypothetical protein